MSETNAPTFPLAERKLASVRIQNMGFSYQSPEGTKYLNFSCDLQLQTFDGQDNGPMGVFWLGVPIKDTTSFQDAERAALDRTFEFIQRLASLSRDQISTCYGKTSNDSRLAAIELEAA